MSEKGFRVEIPVNIKRDRRARKVLANGEPPNAGEAIPHMAMLLALAHKWEGMVRRGEVRQYAEIARRHALSRARVSQICSLVLLPPTAQASIFCLGNSLRSARVPDEDAGCWNLEPHGANYTA